MDDIKKETQRGIKWSAISAVATRIVTFILGIILARLLSPDDFGVVGMAAIFFALAQILIDSGLSTALVRKKNCTKEDTSTIYYFNIIVSSLCCAIIWFFSSRIASFLNAPVLENIVKVSAATMVVGAFGSVHYVMMTKAVNFKTPALISLPSHIIGGVVGVCLAYLGYGPWALVWQVFTANLLRTIIVWFVSDWHPSLIFSIKSLRELYGFSFNITINAVLDAFYREGVGMIIGKYYSPSQLGFYTRGQGTAQLPSTFIYSIAEGVTLPVLSKIQDDDERLIRVYSKYMKAFSMIIFFVMMQFIVLSQPFVIFVYTQKWLPAVIFMQIFGLQYMIHHIHAINWNLLMVKGRSDWALKKEAVNKILNFTCLFIAIQYGPLWICVSALVASVLNILVNLYVAGRLFKYGYKRQMTDFMPYLFLSVICSVPAYLLATIINVPFFALISGFLISSILYFGYFIYKRDELFYEVAQMSPFKKYVSVIYGK